MPHLLIVSNTPSKHIYSRRELPCNEYSTLRIQRFYNQLAFSSTYILNLCGKYVFYKLVEKYFFSVKHEYKLLWQEKPISCVLKTLDICDMFMTGCLAIGREACTSFPTSLLSEEASDTFVAHHLRTIVKPFT